MTLRQGPQIPLNQLRLPASAGHPVIPVWVWSCRSLHVPFMSPPPKHVTLHSHTETPTAMFTYNKLPFSRA